MTDELKARPLELKALIEYAKGAIVSKTLVEQGGGTVTLFAFGSGQGLSEHTAPFDAMVQVLDGEGTFVIGGVENTVTTGQTIIMPASVPHAVRTTQDMKMLLTMIKSKEAR